MSTFSVNLSWKGQLTLIDDIRAETTVEELVSRARTALHLVDDDCIDCKLLYKGKNLVDRAPHERVFPKPPTKTPKILVMATSAATIHEMQTKRSDPLMRGFDNERQSQQQQSVTKDPYWGTNGAHRDYKFCRIQECQTLLGDNNNNNKSPAPHPFQARALLEKLSLDPGLQAVMIERELVVNTLGEMDPVDDRLAQKKEAQGGCLLGYNTNHGLRVDVRLRRATDGTFLPYAAIAATLIHEISHNWFGEHDIFFWTNYGQMRVEYMHAHYIQRSSTMWRGQTSAQIAELSRQDGLDIADIVLQELVPEIAQHGLHPRMIEAAIRQRSRELSESGGKQVGSVTGLESRESRTARELMLEAAEKRAKDKK